MRVHSPSPRVWSFCVLSALVPACGLSAPTRGDASGDAEPITTDAGSPLGDASLDTGAPRVFRVLFDAAHLNSVGNADWVVDTGTTPTPAHPSRESQWSGGISAWAFDLHASERYRIRQLPSGETLSSGDGGPGDLERFDVFISVEPEAAFTAQERIALGRFAERGGGIFLVADHAGAQRCSACIEAWRVINATLEAPPLDGVFGVRCDGNTIAQDGAVGSSTSAQAALDSGPFGSASRLDFHSGTSVSVTGGNRSAVVAVRSRQGGMLVSSSLPSGGRLVVLGDSSSVDDGTCSGCDASLYDGWGEVDNAVFMLNATAWLARDGS